MRIKDKKIKKIPLIITAAALSAIVLGLIIYWQKDNMGSWFGASKDSSKETADDSLGPSSDNTDATDDPAPNSDNNNDTSTDNSSNSSSPSTVSVVINDASQYDSVIEVRSYVQGVVETDGTCTLTFTKDGQTVTRTTGPLTNPSNTTCETVDIPITDFPSQGTWQLTVSYLSSKSKGAATATVEVK